jgi:hypothetical protein
MSMNHSPRRRKVSPSPVRIWPRWVRSIPMYGVFRSRDVRTPRDIVPSIPDRRSYSLLNVLLSSLWRAACNARYCASLRTVSVRLGYFFCECTHLLNNSQRRQSLLENLILITSLVRLSMASLQLRLVLPAGHVACRECQSI